MIKTVIMHKAWNDEISSYADSISELLKTVDTETLGMKDIQSKLDAARDTISKSQRHVRANILTSEIQELNEKRKNTFRVFRDYSYLCKYSDE